jgi:ubiquitin-protein ligase E3 C
MFSPYEMQLLISGEQKPIDIENMRQNVNYGGGYHDNHPYIQVNFDCFFQNGKLLFV